MLAAARLSLKLTLSRAKPNQALSTFTSVLNLILCTMKLYGGWCCSSSVVDFSISSATPAPPKEAWGGIYIAQPLKLVVGGKLTEKTRNAG